MNTTEKKIRERGDGVAKYEATQVWQFFRCDHCDSAGQSPDDIVHYGDCPNRSDNKENSD